MSPPSPATAPSLRCLCLGAVWDRRAGVPCTQNATCGMHGAGVHAAWYYACLILHVECTMQPASMQQASMRIQLASTERAMHHACTTHAPCTKQDKRCILQQASKAARRTVAVRAAALSSASSPNASPACRCPGQCHARRPLPINVLEY